MENNFIPPEPLPPEELLNCTFCIIAYNITYDDKNQACKKKICLVGEEAATQKGSQPIAGNFFDCEDWLHNELRSAFGTFFKDPEGYYHATETKWFKIQPLLKGLPSLYDKKALQIQETKK